jgi:DNA-binding response OmpR family regulator
MKRNDLSMAQQDSGVQNKSAKKIKKKILIADDDPGIQDILTIIFERAGFEVEIKKNGEDLLNNRFTMPDLFLVDKQLSGYNGLDICRYLKSQRHTKNIPVVMISASPDIGRSSREAGADAYIEKPFEITNLVDLVNSYVYHNE